MTVHFFSALFCEAKPIIKHYDLSKLENLNTFSIYSSNEGDITLTITGIGKNNAIKAIKYHHDSMHTHKSDIWLNIGIAGHKNISVGDIRLINKITDDEDKKSWYPQIIFKSECPSIDLVSLNAPSTNYKACLYDMEASGFYQTAIQYGTIELVQSLKIISDNSRTSISKINAENVESLIKLNIDAIEKVLSELKILAKQITSEEKLPNYYELFIEKWHFTQSEKYRLKRMLAKINIRYSNENIFESTNHLGTGKLVLKELENKLTNINFYLN